MPSPPDLNDETGRFGFELGRVRKILEEASPQSLSVLDDCLDGTTHEERVNVLRNVLTLFKAFGGITLFSTHAHELVSEFEANQEGQFLQVEFDGESPTYRVIPGVSHTSHAERVAREHGFSRDQVIEALQQAGASAPDWL